MSVLTWKPDDFHPHGKVLRGNLGDVHMFSVLRMDDGRYKWIAARTILERRSTYRYGHLYATKKTAKAACEAITQEWLSAAGLLDAAKDASSDLIAISPSVENRSKSVNKPSEIGIAGGS